MNGQSPQPPGPADEEPMDVAARRLREEMDTALRHLREQTWGWVPEPDRYRPGATAGGDGEGDGA